MNQGDTDLSTSAEGSVGPESPIGEALPGALRGLITLTLETRQAHRLVKGRSGTAKKPAIIGLIGFANRLRLIWHGARADDPYADWWLLKIHNALELADKTLVDSIDAVQARLSISEALSAMPGASVRPVRTPLRFSNPYAYRGAQLLATYDRLVRVVLTAQHIGVITPKEGERFLAKSGRQLRRAFLSPLGYRMTGITRQDVFQGTARHTQAQAYMGSLPGEVLKGISQAPYGPARPFPASSANKHLTLKPQSSKS